MPAHLDYYLVRFVDLNSGQFYEEEMSRTRIELLKLSNNIGNNIQILNKSYTRTESLVGR
ncbi:hypothetical protein [Bacillus sp. T33-2]|uniref:hypothetical protein n=1 Tax=Bacillus sp. T33-2 TaxID=2054168 RepID=UPI000C786327|nr:hypothetical protein [Bacillus sp. T33-2]PLR99588.1 hypothetical protein CVD19_00565 [Bacillus sp. T33-2]